MRRLVFILVIMSLVAGCTPKPKLPGRGGGSAPAVLPQAARTKRNLPPPPNENTPQPTATRPSRSTAHAAGVLSPSEIFDKYSSAVFKIYTSTGSRGFQGSGFFVSSDGVAVSNYHVFQGTYKGREDIVLSDGTMHKVTKVYHKSEENDFIIFKVGLTRKVNFITISNTMPKVGEKIYTIGSPRGLDNTFSSGEVSQIRDNGQTLQISAPIDHGSSGGVLLNAKGQAVGITSGGIDKSGANLNFALNISLVEPYIP